MRKAITFSFIDGLLRFFTLFLITDLSVSVYTESIFSIIAAALLIAIYYIISHFIAKKVSIKSRHIFYFLSIAAFLFLFFIWIISIKTGVTSIHIFPQGNWDTGTGWAMLLLCTALVVASIIERCIMIFISAYRRKHNDS